MLASRRRRGRPTSLTPYLFLAPAGIYLIVLMGYPLVEGVRLSVTDTTLLQPRAGAFIGTDNYVELLGSPEFLRTLSITLVYTAASVLGAVGIGLLAALGMNRMTGRFRLLRGLVIIPWAVPIIPVALVSTWMLDNQYGVVNWVLTRTGVIEGNVAWLSDENTALPAILAITVWRIFPFSAVVLLAALQSVPGELYEAARVDGTSRLNQFRHVTLPMIRPVLAILVLFVTIWSLRRFDLIWVLTEGGPLGSTTTLVVALYQAAFRESELGLGSAIGVVGFVVAMVVTAGYFVLQARAGKTSGRRDAH